MNIFFTSSLTFSYDWIIHNFIRIGLGVARLQFNSYLEKRQAQIVFIYYQNHFKIIKRNHIE